MIAVTHPPDTASSKGDGASGHADNIDILDSRAVAYDITGRDHDAPMAKLDDGLNP